MKKFRLYSNQFTTNDNNAGSYSVIHEAESMRAVIDEIERGSGWIICEGCAYKIGYVEELKEDE